MTRIKRPYRDTAPDNALDLRPFIIPRRPAAYLIDAGNAHRQQNAHLQRVQSLREVSGYTHLTLPYMEEGRPSRIIYAGFQDSTAAARFVTPGQVPGGFYPGEYAGLVEHNMTAALNPGAYLPDADEARKHALESSDLWPFNL